MDKKLIKNLAIAVVDCGVNVKSGDEVYVLTSVHAVDLTREVVKRAYERGAKRVIGTLEVLRRDGMVTPDNLKQPKIFINKINFGGAKDGDKVICEVLSYPKGKAPDGKVIEVLGESGELECEELSIIRAFNLTTEFDEEVLKQADEVAAKEIVLGDRRDLRDKLIFTIDGEDTRDIDDGISLEKSGKNYVLGVHIADVSHYVLPRTALDNEAYARGTSVYFPDRVLPMLPKALSNGACSLNEGEDRYALSCVMTFDENGARKNYEVFKSVIRSRHKTTYPEIAAICAKDPHICRKYGDLTDTVYEMEKLCLLMEKRREKEGSVNLDVMDAHIYVDENGEIVIPPCERSISQRIIEQFMISANEAVAEFLTANKAPCLYRIHERPAPEKAENFYAFLRDLGINANADFEEISPGDFQKILKSAEDKPFYSVVNKVMLRTMQKARYAEVNVGHFGLASKCYCHFTSPIRRYPDLFVHRAVKCVLENKGDKLEKLKKTAAENAAHCSDRERVADEAERKVDDLYKLAYMYERLGETYDATISGVTQHGIYCELKNTVEGLIPLEDLPADRYEYIPEKFLLKGVRRSFRLGDTVRIEVVDCDLGRMKVLFMLR
ncbi:MAG: ribonuclease R [Clostridia bacterium]|nr:ribonuclease R [Clostridia bacterium]